MADFDHEKKWWFHGMAKSMFKAFMKTCSKAIRGEVKEYYFSPAVRAFKEAMDLVIEEEMPGSEMRQFYSNARDVVCVMAESQAYYRAKFDQFAFLFYKLMAANKDWIRTMEGKEWKH